MVDTCFAKKKEIKSEISNFTNLVTKAYLNAKINEAKGESS